MPDLHFPLSGDVTQTINPWTWFFRAVGNQTGLVNINLGRSSDPDLELKILDQVGTYGRQIGQIGDALRVLIDHVPLPNLSPREQDALAAFRAQLDEVERVKRKARLDRAEPEATP